MHIPWSNLQQFPSYTQAGDLQGWVDLAGDNQVKIRRQIIDQICDHSVDIRFMNNLVVVQDQEAISFEGDQGIDQLNYYTFKIR